MTDTGTNVIDNGPVGADADESDNSDGETGASASLRVDGLTKKFGGLTAVDGISFEMEQGALTGLIGPNGAGKTTAFNCLTGFYTPNGGTVTFSGDDITGLRPDQIAKHGVVRTFQIARELEEMTVLENMMLGYPDQLGESVTYAVMPRLRERVKEEEREMREEVWEALEFFEIDHLADEEAGNLSGGQRKLLEIARALMTDPQLLLLDEPFAGVNPTLEKKILERLQSLKQDGLTFLLVEHDMDLVMDNCEHIIVMHQGQILTEGPPHEIQNNRDVINAYLGEDI